MNSKISNERMTAFQNEIVRQVRELLFDREDDILTSWQENIEEAQHNEKEGVPPLKLTIGATVDIQKNNISTQLSFTAKYSSTLCVPLPDPNQPDLPGTFEG